MKNFTHKKPVLILSILAFFLVILSVFLVRKLDSLTPIVWIDGIYYGNYSNGSYSSYFYKNHFEIQRGTDIIASGSYEQLDKHSNTYFINDAVSNTKYLLVLDHSGFYFFDYSSNRVQYMKKHTSSADISLGKPQE